jgi:hypothetical protein
MPMHEPKNAIETARLRAMYGDLFSLGLMAEVQRLRQKFPKLHPDRQETLAWLKASDPDKSDEELLQDMEDWGF